MEKKNKYSVRVVDRAIILAIVTGANKEVLLRKAAKIARANKTRWHYKEGIPIYVYLQSIVDGTYLRTMSF